MFIRETKRKRPNSDNVFRQYSLVQSTRIDGKARQSTILYLGSSPLLHDKVDRNIVRDILQSKIQRTNLLFDDSPEALVSLAEQLYQKYLIRYNMDESEEGLSLSHSLPPKPELADFQQVDLKSFGVSEVKAYGPERLCKHIVDLLGLRACFTKLGFSDFMVDKCCISIIARAVYAASEYKTAQILELNSNLNEMYNVSKRISHKQLYTVADKLHEYREQINNHIFQKATDLFDLDNKLVIFDISNTYFETGKRNSKIAKYGRSKEKRYDCPLVVFTGVINAQGFIKYSRIYEGNKPDSDTLKDMISDLKKNTSGTEDQTIVLDAGIATKDNLKMIDEENLKYVCVSRKRLKDYPVDPNTEKKIQLTDRKKGKVELSIFTHPDHDDNWMYVQSEQKRKKEQSIAEKLHLRFVTELEKISTSLSTKGGVKAYDKVNQRLGRQLEKHRRVSGQYKIQIHQKDNKATSLEWSKKDDTRTKTDKENGVYFIRTNRDIKDEGELWKIYNCIREVESTFRCLKTDLKIRPIEHQNDERIRSHISLTILAYQLVNTIRYMLKEKGITHDWKNIKRIMSTQTIQTVIMPTKEKDIRVRLPSNPIKEVQQIYSATNCKSTIARKRKSVVYH